MLKSMINPDISGKTILYKGIILVLGMSLFLSSLVFCGPNENASIVFDLDATTYGNQNQISMDPPSVGDYIRVDVYAINVHNLDTYEFEVLYNPGELEYITATATNPITYEENILTSNGGEALGPLIDTSTPGVLSISMTLTGTDTTEAPEGEGLVADIVFQALSIPEDTLTFGDVYFYDSFGVMDVITDKGIATFQGAQIVSVSPDSLDFGVVLVGLDSTKQFTIENVGSEELSGEITTPPDFTVGSGSKFVKRGQGLKNSLSFNIPVGDSVTYDLTFAPSLAQAYSDSVVITYNDQNNGTVYLPVYGDGVPVTPEISVSPDFLDFGVVLVGSDSTKQFTIENIGGAELSGEITTPPDFTVGSGSKFVKRDQGSKNSLSFNIPVGESITYDLTFAPSLPQTYSDSVVITSNDPSNGTVYLPVSGEGIVTLEIYHGGSYDGYAMGEVQNASFLIPAISVSPDSLDFGVVLVGSDSTKQFTIENIGSEELSGEITTPLDFTVGSGSKFVKRGQGLKNSLSFNIPVGDSITYDLTFAPSLAQAYSDSVVITYNDPSNGSVYLPVYGDGVPVTPAISVLPDSLVFGVVSVGSDSTKQFTIANIGGAELSGEITTPPDFTVGSGSKFVGRDQGSKNSLSFNIPVGESITYDLTFAPSLPQTYSDSVVITSNDPSNGTVYLPVSGEGIVTLEIYHGGSYDGYATGEVQNASFLIPAISVSPSSIDFGVVLVGSDSTKQFTIENIGSAELSGEITTPPDFTVGSGSKFVKRGQGLKNSLSFNIPVGDSVTYDLTFAPSLAQAYSDSVVITSNDPSNGTVYLPVSGEGIAGLPPPGNVIIVIEGSNLTITWGSVSGATDYKVYISDDPYTGFSELATTGGATTYTHINGATATKYFYQVTALNGGSATMTK